MPHEARTLTITIDRSADDVYAFISDPAHLPDWAPGFAHSIHRDGETWVAETVDGPMAVEFVADNPHRVADHVVTVSPGVTNLNPVRVLDNGDGAEVLFTVIRAEGQSAEAFAEIQGLVKGDLALLRELLETTERPTDG
jgi:hypothetical protein